ncbi:UNVERIFIED_CONTAM: hypothetical protein NCL1_36578 [Trichonephila clavipes]
MNAEEKSKICGRLSCFNAPHSTPALESSIHFLQVIENVCLDGGKFEKDSFEKNAKSFQVRLLLCFVPENRQNQKHDTRMVNFRP